MINPKLHVILQPVSRQNALWVSAPVHRTGKAVKNAKYCRRVENENFGLMTFNFKRLNKTVHIKNQLYLSLHCITGLIPLCTEKSTSPKSVIPTHPVECDRELMHQRCQISKFHGYQINGSKVMGRQLFRLRRPLTWLHMQVAQMGHLSEKAWSWKMRQYSHKTQCQINIEIRVFGVLG